MAYSDDELWRIANKTLARNEYDSSPISPSYLAHLKGFLARLPTQYDFILDDGGQGHIICNACEDFIEPGRGEPEDPTGIDYFGSLVNWEDHIYTQQHLSHMPILPHLPPKSISRNVLTMSQLYRIANITLCRPENDVAPVPPEYFAHLKGFLFRNPEDDNFILDDQTGHIICGKCGDIISPGPRTNQTNFDVLGSFLNYEAHLVSHNRLSQQPAEFTIPLRPSYNIRSPSHEKRKRSIGPDAPFEVLEISSDEDEKPPLNRPKYEYREVVEGSSRGFIKTEQPVDTWPFNPILPVAGPSIPPQPSIIDSWNPLLRPMLQQQLLQQQLVQQQLRRQQAQPPFENTAQYPHEPILPEARHAAIDPPFDPQAAEENWKQYGYGANATSFNINYDDEGPVRNIDINGSEITIAEQLKDFIQKAGDTFKGTLSVNEALRKLNLTNLDDCLPGMEIPLMAHQVIGVAWMLEQEAATRKRGGILADEMGLGKTVQMLATMVVHRPESDAYKDLRNVYDFHERKATLVVAPSALLQQWRSEIESKTKEGLLKVVIHHGKFKLKTPEEVDKYDVVITTYHTLNQDFPRPKKKMPENGQPVPEEEEYVDESENWKMLAKVKWLRVVLDEAQYARNRSTITSRNVAELDATHRWALTGTPVTNTLADLYALLRFCHLPPFNDWGTFNSHIAKLQQKNPTRAGAKAQAVMKSHLLRRTKLSKIDGKPILELGPKSVEFIELEFSPEEREVYDRLESEQKLKLSKFIKAGTVMKNYQFILVMILRLRQACSHPSLLLYKPEGGIDGAPQDELARAAGLMGEEWVAKLKKRLLDDQASRLNTNGDIGGEECPICFDTFVGNGRVTSCMHKFCAVCLEDLFKTNNPNRPENARDDGNAERDFERGFRTCPVCRQMMDPNKIFASSAFEPPEDDEVEKEEPTNIKSADSMDWMFEDEPDLPDPSSLSIGPSPVKVKAEEVSAPINSRVKELGKADDKPRDIKGKGKAKADPDILDGLVDEDDFEPSTKMVKMFELLMQWHEENPEDKVILYSQWTSMLNLVHALMRKNKIEVLRYDGKMGRIDRDETLVKFKKRNGPRIILISLKCGGVGLNLVEANRIINLDLAWNYATEAQAYDRVHRLGQRKPVFIKRLVINRTIEERMVKLQFNKQQLSDAALGEGKGGKIPKLSVKELAELFDLHI